MKQLNIDLEDTEHKKLMRLKGQLTWKEYLMREVDKEE